MSDNPNNYWFKRRRYGWGWFPVTWQGWLCLLIFIAVIALDVIFVAPRERHAPLDWRLPVFIAILVANVIGLFYVCAHHGPKPRWRFGKNPNDNSDKDF